MRKLPSKTTQSERLVAQLRNARGISVDQWIPLELKSAPVAMIRTLAFLIRQNDEKLTVPISCLTKLICFLPKARPRSADCVADFTARALERDL